MQPGQPVSSAAPPYDVERVRADFPILATQVHGHPLTYLDNAASAQKPRAVLDAVQRALSEEYANVHRGLHYLSTRATERYEGARERVRAFLNAPRAEDIIFTANATDAINLVASSFGGARIGEGDEIILTQMEHHSNIVPWHFFRERTGAVIRWAPVADDGSLSVEAVTDLITPRTKMIAMTHMSNVLGTITPVKEIVRAAHDAGVPVMVDGSQGAVHLTVDVQDLDADFYIFTAHKVYGPTGLGVLYGKAEHLAAMPPYRGGGEMIREVHFDGVEYGDAPTRFEAGTPPFVEAAALHAALDYMDAIGKPAIAAHETALAEETMARLRDIPGLRLIGEAPGKSAIVSFAFDGLHAHDVSTIADRFGVAVRAGHHCAQPLMERFGVTSSLRASFGLYNTRGDIDRLIAALDKARMMLG